MTKNPNKTQYLYKAVCIIHHITHECIKLFKTIRHANIQPYRPTQPHPRLLQIPSGLPRCLESALHRYGSSTFKALAVTVLDQNGKPSVNLTYGTDHRGSVDVV